MKINEQLIELFETNSYRTSNSFVQTFEFSKNNSNIIISGPINLNSCNQNLHYNTRYENYLFNITKPKIRNINEYLETIINIFNQASDVYEVSYVKHRKACFIILKVKATNKKVAFYFYQLFRSAIQCCYESQSVLSGKSRVTFTQYFISMYKELSRRRKVKLTPLQKIFICSFYNPMTQGSRLSFNEEVLIYPFVHSILNDADSNYLGQISNLNRFTNGTSSNYLGHRFIIPLKLNKYKCPSNDYYFNAGFFRINGFASIFNYKFIESAVKDIVDVIYDYVILNKKQFKIKE